MLGRGHRSLGCATLGRDHDAGNPIGGADMHDYQLTCEPSGVVLQEILTCAQASDVAWFGVVHDPKNRWAPTRAMWRTVWAALEPHLSTVEEVDRWPGSQLLVGDMAFRYLFPLSDAVVEAVVGVGESLYEWESRHSPCDPHLLYPRQVTLPHDMQRRALRLSLDQRCHPRACEG